PTSRPAATTTPKPASMRGAGRKPAGASNVNVTGATSMPARNVRRQPASPAFGPRSPPRMPLMPRTRPLTRMKMAVATPSSMPPASDVQGVKWVQSMLMGSLLWLGAGTGCLAPGRVGVAELQVERFDHGERLRARQRVVNVLAVATRGDQPLLT